MRFFVLVYIISFVIILLLHLLEVALLSTTTARIQSSNFSTVLKSKALRFKKDLKVILVLILVVELVVDYYFTISTDKIISLANSELNRFICLSALLFKKVIVFILFKNLALAYCDSISIILSNIFYPIFFILRPIGKIIGFFTFKLFKIFEKEDSRTIDNKIKEIILMLEDNSTYLEEVETAQYFLALRELQVQQVMIPLSKCGTIEWKADKDLFLRNMESLLQHDYVLVWEEEMDNLIGIIDIKDYLLFMRSGDENIFSIFRKPKFILSTMTADKCLKWIRRDQTDALCVVNPLGGLCGLVTFEDLSKRIFQYDQGNNIIKLSDHLSIVVGNCNIRAINRKMHWKIPQDYTSIGGLFIYGTGDLPTKDAKIVVGGYEFFVLSVKSSGKSTIKSTIKSDPKNIDPEMRISVRQLKGDEISVV